MMMMRSALVLAGVSVVGLLGQEPQRPLTFEVTSVKPNTSGEQGGSSKAQPGRYVGINVTLKRVMRLAYRPVQEFVGGPEWINTDRFDIEGRSTFAPLGSVQVSRPSRNEGNGGVRADGRAKRWQVGARPSRLSSV
jgi:hypothetical protein